MTFLTSLENLKIGLITSQFWAQLFMALGYFGSHFSVTRSNWARPCSSLGARYIVFKSAAKAFISLYGTYLRVFLTWCTMHLWYSVSGKAVPMASLIPVNPSAQIIITSFTPRFFSSFRTPSQYLLLSFSPIWRLITSFLPSRVIARIT